MNYLSARQKVDGKWHYTCQNNNRVWPVGYCSPHAECPVCHGEACFSTVFKEEYGGTPCVNCNNTGFILKEDACQGHDTEEDACEHYKQYLLDNIRYTKSSSSMHKCRICGEWTTGIADVSMSQYYTICEEHQNRESMATIVSVGVSWES